MISGVAGAARRFGPLLGGLTLVLAIAAVYANSLMAPFVFDDELAILRNPTITRLWPLSIPLSPPHDGSAVTGRPLLNFSYALNYAWSGGKVWSYHLLNLALHALAALALFGILRRTRAFASGTLPALAAALLWAVHPLLTESVTCVAQRSESMMGLFYLLTIYCLVRYVGVGLDGSESRPYRGGAGRDASPRRPISWAILSVLSCLLGMATKEVMVTAPVIALLYDRTFMAGSFAEAWRRRKGYYLGLASTWLLLAFLVAGSGGRRGSAAGFGIGVTPWSYAVTQCGAIVHYLRLAFWPHPLILDYGTGLARPREVMPQAVFLLLLVGGAVWALVRRPAWGFLGAWFFVILAPSSSFVPLVTQTMAEHRMYLPLAAVTTAAVWAGHARWGSKALAVFLALGILLGGFTARRNAVFGSPLAIWSDTVARSPDNARAYHGLGMALAGANRPEEAAAAFRHSLALDPRSGDAENQFGLILAGIGRIEEAIPHYRRAIALGSHPSDIAARNNLGMILAQTGRAEEAVALYRQALAMDPGLAEAEGNLGLALESAGRAEEAMAHLQRALDLRVQPAELRIKLSAALAALHYNRANVLVGQGRKAEAMASYETALAISPGLAKAENNLGILLAQTGRVDDAIRHFQAALRLDPVHSGARENLVLALRAAGRDGEAEAITAAGGARARE